MEGSCLTTTEAGKGELRLEPEEVDEAMPAAGWVKVIWMSSISSSSSSDSSRVRSMEPRLAVGGPR
jgi:hypothetical protein